MNKLAGFGKVSRDVLRDPDIPLRDKGLYSYLASYADGNSGECTVSIQRIASECGITNATVKRSIAFLEEKGLIARQYRGIGQTRKTTLLK